MIGKSKWFLALVFLFVANLAVASQDQIKITYHPGYVMSGRTIETTVSDTFEGHDALIAAVFQKLKEIEALGRLDYIVPDAPFITIEVTLSEETIKSSNALVSSRLEEYIPAQKLWEEAYAMVWGTLEENLNLDK